MHIIKTLENTTLDEILEVFNLAFSDYLVPLHLTKEKLELKMHSEHIKLEYSVGAFENNKLIAFVLHGFQVTDHQKIIYNGGTGVVPAHRGKRLIAQLYNHVLPTFKNEQINAVLLEVITGNEKAIKTYQQIGFQINRKVVCYRGSISTEKTISPFSIKTIETIDWKTLQGFWDFNPTWQNTIHCVENLSGSNISLGIYEKDILRGYLIFNPKLKRILQFAVDKEHRKKGIGRQLFHYYASHYEPEVTVFNVDDLSLPTKNLFSKLGVNTYVEQYEMALPIS